MNTENNTNHALHGNSTNDTSYPYCLSIYEFLQDLSDHPLMMKIYEEQQNFTKQQ